MRSSVVPLVPLSVPRGSCGRVVTVITRTLVINRNPTERGSLFRLTIADRLMLKKASVQLSISRRRHCRSTISRRYRRPVICGRPAIGPGKTTLVITGCRGRGYCRRSRGCCGSPAIGVGTTASMPFTKGIGAQKSASMGACLMASAIPAPATRAAIGAAAISSITAPLTTSPTCQSPTSITRPSSSTTRPT